MNKKYLISGIILLIIIAGTTTYFASNQSRINNITNQSRINNLALKELCTTSGGEYRDESKKMFVAKLARRK